MLSRGREGDAEKLRAGSSTVNDGTKMHLSSEHRNKEGGEGERRRPGPVVQSRYKRAEAKEESRC